MQVLSSFCVDECENEGQAVHTLVLVGRKKFAAHLQYSESPINELLTLPESQIHVESKLSAGEFELNGHLLHLIVVCDGCPPNADVSVLL